MIIESLFLPDLLDGLTLEASGTGLRAIRFGESAAAEAQPGPVVRQAELQLREYFAGKRFSFDLPLDLAGTPFQIAVWQALIRIPYNRTASYRDIAAAVSSPKGFRAIGQANNRNPIPIVVPCHRVINADGSIGGYSGGPDRKRALLELERRHAA